MIQKLSEPISVVMQYDCRSKKVSPRRVIWGGRLYLVVKVGLHHTFRRGKILFHVFSVATESLFLRLILNTEDLHWRVEEISDGLPD